MTNGHDQMAPPRYHVILNWDGDHALTMAEAPMDAETFKDILYGDLDHAAVDCVFWNGSPGSTAFYPSDVLEFKGETLDQGFKYVTQWRSITNARTMIKRGEDPNQIAIDGARQHRIDVFFSFRMNDQHQDDADMPRLKHDHPEWLLGDKVPAWFNTSWDYTHAGVREHRLAMIREIANKYDFDGIELDWQRHAHHLPVHEAFRRKYVLTDFMRVARQIVNEAGQRRGRPLWLAARVAASKEGCMHVGYDIEQWVHEKLIDYLIPSACAEMDPSIDGQWWSNLCARTPIRVYPSLGGWFYNQTHGTGDQETHFVNATRALGARLHSEGVDGFYTFNWYGKKRLRRGLMQQLANPASLARATKTYISTGRPYREPGSDFAGIDDQDRIYGEVPVELHPTTTQIGPTVTWQIVDDAPASAKNGELERITLRLHLRDYSPKDELSVRYDDELLSDPTIRCPEAEDENDTATVGGMTWMDFNLAPDMGSTGAHTVQISLRKRNADLGCPLVLLDVDLEIVYVSG